MALCNGDRVPRVPSGLDARSGRGMQELQRAAVGLFQPGNWCGRDPDSRGLFPLLQFEARPSSTTSATESSRPSARLVHRSKVVAAILADGRPLHWIMG